MTAAAVPAGVSVLTCTKRRECMDALLRNYGRQTYRPKELIIVLNGSKLDPDVYRQAAEPYPNVRIFRLPADVSLGSCLNFGVRAARYGCIAKFDDDDYYAPGYLADSMQTLFRTGADVVGKRAHFLSLAGRKDLLFRYYAKSDQFVPLVQGATLLVKRHVFRHLAFPDTNRGECVTFCAGCRAQGFRIYAGSPYHFLAFRKRNSRNHTWKVSDRKLLTRNVKILKTRNPRRFVSREGEGSLTPGSASPALRPSRWLHAWPRP